MSKYYVATCPLSERVFICEQGVDNNLCEVFARNAGETARSVALRLVFALNTADGVLPVVGAVYSSISDSQERLLGFLAQRDEEWLRLTGKDNPRKTSARVGSKAKSPGQRTRPGDPHPIKRMS